MCQDVKGKHPNQVHSLPRDSRGRVKSGQERNRLSYGHSLPGEWRGSDKSGYEKKTIKQSTHSLMTAGGTTQGVERKRPSVRLSPSGGHNGRDKSG